MIIDGKQHILGRVVTFAAKQALLGNRIDIINCEYLVLSGSKKDLEAKYKARDQRGDPHHGPYYPKVPHMMVKRVVRGMLPYKQERGRRAFERVRCYVGVPEQFTGKETVTLSHARADKLTTIKQRTVGEIAHFLKMK